MENGRVVARILPYGAGVHLAHGGFSELPRSVTDTTLPALRAALFVDWDARVPFVNSTAEETTAMKKLSLVAMLFFPAYLAFGQASVLTQHNDNGRTGQNLNETILTPSNVNSTTFGKLFSMSVDGYLYAQPLYMPSVSIAGGTHNVVFVATEGDSVYAFDADTGTQLWHASVIDTAHGATSGETTVSISELQTALGDPTCTDLTPQIGITSTPVIDSSTGTIYVEAKSEKTNGTMVHRLHMLNIATGAEISPGPVVITATVSGTSGGGTTITFDAVHHLNRPGLLLANGEVYLGYASHCDDGPWHGWLFAYNASTLTRTAVFISTPNGVGDGGIWMSGAGIAADSSGNIFTATGNGNYDATDEGDSILKLNGSALTLSDYFTPFDQGNDQENDLDVASGGVLLLPTQPGAHPDELILGTKGGTIYLINRDQMTTNNEHYCSGCTSDPEIVQEILHAGNVGWLWATPAFYNNTVYFWGQNDVLKAYILTNGLLGAAPSSSSTITLQAAATPSISANGDTNGILWAIDSSRSVTQAAILYAFDPSNVAHEYYNSTQAGSRDVAGVAVKFTVPTIANGKVYVGTRTEVDVYGLIGSGEQQAATPSISPSSGTESSPVTVTLTDSTAGATITYTTDGSTPVPGSHGTAISSGGSFSLSFASTATVEAIASASGMTNSGIATATYTTQSSGGGSPSYGSGFTSTGLTLNGNGVVNAAINGTRLRLTDGGDYEATSAFFNTPVDILSFTTNFSFQLTDATADGIIFTIQGDGPTALGQNGAKLGWAFGKAGTSGIGNSVAVKFDIYNNDGEGTDSTGMFTDGARPTIPAVDMTSSGLNLLSGDVMNVSMTYNGTTLSWTITDATTGKTFTTSAAVDIPSIVGGNTAYVGFTASTEAAAAAIQDILTWTFVPGSSSSAVATPSISPSSGTESSPVTVTLTDSTAGATITYTTDGSTPVPGSHGTAISSGGSFSLSFASTATVEAIASASGMTNSGIATATYTTQSSGGGSPSYGSGFTSTGLTLNGNGVVNAAINGTRLRLTDGGDYEATSAFFNTPVDILSFTTNFSFQLTDATADGIIFTIQGDGPTALGQNGAKLGWAFGKAGTSGIGNSVAVKFDIYNNDGEGTDSTGMFTDGARPTIPAVDMTSSGLNLLSGDVMNVSMTYNGTTLSWTITDATTGKTFTTSAAVDIPSIVGGNTAYVGFTASTEAAAAAIQDILTWTFVPGT